VADTNATAGTGSTADGGGVGTTAGAPLRNGGRGDAIEIWDVRRGWIPKWAVGGSAIEGGVTGTSFLSEILSFSFGTN
jgi:hypothetical protein